MAIRGFSAASRRLPNWHTLAVACLCAVFQVAAAEEQRDEPAKEPAPDADTTENSMPEIRIKRLRLADPESRELMLASVLSEDMAHRAS